MAWAKRALRMAMVLGLAGCGVPEPAPSIKSGTIGAMQSAPARLLVQPRPGLALERLDEILRVHGARRVNVIRQINVHVVELPSGADVQEVARRLADHPAIESVEIDRNVPPARS